MADEKEQGKGSWFKDKTVKPIKLTADIKQLLPDVEYPADLPGPARRFTEFLRVVIFFAKTEESGYTYDISLPCRRRPGRKKCPGKVLIYLETEESDIHWGCPVCGDSGTITGAKTQRWLDAKTGEDNFRKETLH